MKRTSLWRVLHLSQFHLSFGTWDPLAPGAVVYGWAIQRVQRELRWARTCV